MAAFPGKNGTTILIRNHELSPFQSPGVIAVLEKQYDSLCQGGTTTLIIDRDRRLLKHYASLAGTSRNCGGGVTPWGSWISCEEDISIPQENTKNVLKKHGYNFEVPSQAQGLVAPIPLKGMGRFNHEAVAVDPKTGIVYQTEDQIDSLFYRFVPNQAGKLQAGGTLEALKIKEMPQVNTKSDFPVNKPMQVEWIKIEDVDPDTDTVRVEGFTKGAAQFSRGEGICYGNGEIYFCCTNGGAINAGQIWRYLPQENTIELFLEASDRTLVENPDNIIVSPWGDLFFCEDGGGEQFIVGVTPAGKTYKFARNAINELELAGACFSPDGSTMFVNIQNPGITFAIWGPWSEKLG
jgi:secreted PhoX family phosphatase